MITLVHSVSARPTVLRLIEALAVILLALHILFAHGCHSDHDNELFVCAGEDIAAPLAP